MRSVIEVLNNISDFWLEVIRLFIVTPLVTCYEMVRNFLVRIGLEGQLLLALGIILTVIGLLISWLSPYLSAMSGTTDRSMAIYNFFRLLAVLIVVVVLLTALKLQTNPGRKGAYAVFFFLIAGGLAIIAFVPFLATGLNFATPVGLLMLACIVIMSICSSAWGTVKNVFSTALNTVWHAVKGIRHFTK